MKKNLAAIHWSKIDCSASERNFYCFPPIRARSSLKIFDEYDPLRKEWCEYWTAEKYLKGNIPFGKCLSICCGFGSVERTLARLGIANEFVGTDVAPGAIAEAQKRAHDENLLNISYVCEDLNTVTLPHNEYNIIWANGALHHIENLDKVIENLHNSLHRGGFLVANEYVGPNYQQIGRRQEEIINAVRHLLPDDLCNKETIHGLSVWKKGLRFIKNKVLKLPKGEKAYFGKIFERHDLRFFEKTDPSECVNSINVIPTLKKYFSQVDVRYFDGSIAFYAFDEKFYANFDASNPDHMNLLNIIFDIEDRFIASGEIGRDNAHIICRK
ncbi:class I SAM-dependent methyltransferase [Nitratidesulfovibrio sp. SRB-5]|uniref:class I SAM-dependent methyltransferase n=1 Tax=Nitratidesulfovibrio sp. SRB-5 TaxID=2872636 RepID=UPI001CBB907D|nr:class I SAM-dependent methyltransferase [Nitratidesulfovibrio sp. SRB-5]MBZ2170927.1 class I SAM-dependent methyltransferase [Nitratidesulfovibrio sp. SRB-5]